MPELPEVETTRRGLEPHITGARIDALRIRESRLRWPIPSNLSQQVRGQKVLALQRRGKYLLLQLENGYLLIHLGMSGSLRIVPAHSQPRRHDHFDLVFGARCLRYHDPRRFGALLWSDTEITRHPLLAQLGPEPLADTFDGDYLYRAANGRKLAVKSFLMDGKIVVGVGNIYANEALFMSGIHPRRASGRISLARYRRLAGNIKQVLAQAIAQGGTTLRDFVNGDGNPGYFAQQLRVYDRAGRPCINCGRAIRQQTIAQRSSYYCAHCQR